MLILMMMLMRASVEVFGGVDNMKRTTIQAEEGLILELQQLAYRLGTSTSTVVREALAEYVVKHREEAKLPSFSAVGSSGRRDVSERAEEILAEDVEKDSGWSG